MLQQRIQMFSVEFAIWRQVQPRQGAQHRGRYQWLAADRCRCRSCSDWCVLLHQTGCAAGASGDCHRAGKASGDGVEAQGSCDHDGEQRKRCGFDAAAEWTAAQRSTIDERRCGCRWVGQRCVILDDAGRGERSRETRQDQLANASRSCQSQLADRSASSGMPHSVRA